MKCPEDSMLKYANKCKDPFTLCLEKERGKGLACVRPLNHKGLHHAHDPDEQCQEGDEVIIRETRPISKTKAWTVTRLLEKSRGV